MTNNKILIITITSTYLWLYIVKFVTKMYLFQLIIKTSTKKKKTEIKLGSPFKFFYLKK